jgi:hypothetical protein
MYASYELFTKITGQYFSNNLIVLLPMDAFWSANVLVGGGSWEYEKLFNRFVHAKMSGNTGLD